MKQDLLAVLLLASELLDIMTSRLPSDPDPISGFVLGQSFYPSCNLLTCLSEKYRWLENCRVDATEPMGHWLVSNLKSQSA